MQFRIADTFTQSLIKLTAQEQKAAKITTYDLQTDPSSPGLKMHRIEKSKDANFWSVRVNDDIRIIIHKTAANILLAYVNHHDDAYKWASKRKIEQHPSTGAMQIVEIRELVEDVVIKNSVDKNNSEETEVETSEIEEPITIPPIDNAKSKKVLPKLFDNLRKFELMSFGVPEDWVDLVRDADEESIFEVIPHLPQEAQEALLCLAVGEAPKPIVVPEIADETGFEHPDAMRRFRLLNTPDELRIALEYPWDKWAVFLHPSQQTTVDKDFSGPAKVSGSAGTGKTIVTIHRAHSLAKLHPGKKVLLTTFSKALANSLKAKINILIGGNEELSSQFTVKAIKRVAYDLFTARFGQPQMTKSSQIKVLIEKYAKSVEGLKLSSQFLYSEFIDIVDAWQLSTWDDYCNVVRLGRKARLGNAQREQAWQVFEPVIKELKTRKLHTWSMLLKELTNSYLEKQPPFDFVVVDEAQDLSVAEARFLGKIWGEIPNGIFLSGDLGQRIFQQAFSLKSMGIDVRGRSSNLKINYRTSHQIRAQADKLLPDNISDVDGNKETRTGTISLFDGPTPEIAVFNDLISESEAVAIWINSLIEKGIKAQDIALIVRCEDQLNRAKQSMKLANIDFVILEEDVEVQEGKVTISTMHLAKGLEFKAVAVIACDDDVLPLSSRIEKVSDNSDLEEVYNTERHLLYVACTRARDFLWISGIKPGSEFLEDMLN